MGYFSNVIRDSRLSTKESSLTSITKNNLPGRQYSADSIYNDNDYDSVSHSVKTLDAIITTDNNHLDSNYSESHKIITLDDSNVLNNHDFVNSPYADKLNENSNENTVVPDVNGSLQQVNNEPVQSQVNKDATQPETRIKTTNTIADAIKANSDVNRVIKSTNINEEKKYSILTNLVSENKGDQCIDEISQVKYSEHKVADDHKNQTILSDTIPAIKNNRNIEVADVIKKNIELKKEQTNVIQESTAIRARHETHELNNKTEKVKKNITPQVRIGQVNIVIESPHKQTAQQIMPTSSELSSRLLLRGL